MQGQPVYICTHVRMALYKKYYGIGLCKELIVGGGGGGGGGMTQNICNVENRTLSLPLEYS